MAEAALSFLGFGLPPDIPSWGGMLSREGRQYMEIAPHLALWPGACGVADGGAVHGRVGKERTDGPVRSHREVCHHDAGQADREGVRRGVATARARTGRRHEDVRRRVAPGRTPEGSPGRPPGRSPRRSAWHDRELPAGRNRVVDHRGSYRYRPGSLPGTSPAARRVGSDVRVTSLLDEPYHWRLPRITLRSYARRRESTAGRNGGTGRDGRARLLGSSRWIQRDLTARCAWLMVALCRRTALCGRCNTIST